MSSINYYLTTSEKLNSILEEKGNLIFCQDTHTIYLDDDNGRSAYQQIVCLDTDDLRQTQINSLVSGFYFVLSTNILWRLDGRTWYQITERPNQLIVYGTLSSFPRPGNEATLYRTSESLYHWDSTLQAYVDYCHVSPQWIREI